MKRHPILFTGPMVRAILDGRKTQPRRLHGRYKVGDVLWVKETFLPIHAGATIMYRSDMEPLEAAGFGAMYGGWKPSLFMRQEHSRIDLEVTEVRAQRIQDISAEDCRSEGIMTPRCGCDVCATSSDICTADRSEYVLAFAQLWNSINCKPGTRWQDNPTVWAYTFRRIKP